MEEKIAIASKIHPSIKEHLDKFCQLNDIDESKAIAVILAEYFGFAYSYNGVVDAPDDYIPSTPYTLDALRTLEEMVVRLIALEDRAITHQEYKAHYLERISALEQTVEKMQQQIIAQQQRPEDPLNAIYEKHYGNGTKKNSKRSRAQTD